MIEAAGALLDKQRALDRAEAVIDAALQNDDTDAVEAEDEASSLENEATVANARGLAAAAQAGAADPWPPVDGAADLIRMAGGHLTSVRRLITGAAGTDDARKLAFEGDRLDEAVRTLSSQLEHLR